MTEPDFDPAEAAALILGLLDAVAKGDLEATSPAAMAILHRLEGARIALESLMRQTQGDEFS